MIFISGLIDILYYICAMKAKALIIILLLFVCFTVNAKYICELTDFAYNGMPHARLSNAQQDSDGFIWFATWNGLVRFDGYKYYTFKPTMNSNGEITSNRIYKLRIGTNDGIWCVSDEEKLFYFDKRTNRYFDIHKRIKDIGNKKVKTFFVLNKGVTWVVFKDNTCLRMYDRDIFHNHSVKKYKSRQGKDMIVNTIFQDKNGKEWVLCNDFHHYQETCGSVFFIDNKGNAIVRQGNRAYLQKLSSSSVNHTHLIGKDRIALATEDGIVLYDIKKRAKHRYLKGYNISFLFIDSKERIWAFCGTNKVMMINTQTNKSLTLYSTTKCSSGPEKNPQLIFENSDKTVFLKLQDGKLSYYNEATQNLVECTFFSGQKKVDFNPSLITKFLFNSQNKLWVFQKQGASLVVIRNNRFLNNDIPSRTECRALEVDHLGRFLYADKTNRLVLSGSNILNTKKPAYCIKEDEHNRLWVGTKGDGLYVLTPTDATCTSYTKKHFSTSTGNFPADTIYDIAFDEKGNALIGSFGRGIFRMYYDNGRVKLQNFPSLPLKKVRDIEYLGNNILAIATTGGLVIGDISYDKIPKFYTNLYRVEEWGMKGSDVMKVLKYKNDLYAFVYGNGIIKTQLNNIMSESIHFQTFQLPSSNTADQILSAAIFEKNIWIVSQQSITRFGLNNNKARIFTAKDFCGIHTFSEATPVMLGNDILVGTTQGFMSFNPKECNDHHFMPSIVFTGIQYQNNMAISPLNDIDEININPYERSLSLYVSSLEYGNMQDSRYRYMIKDYDKGWNYTDENQSAIIYNNLEPGNYVLVVQCTDQFGEWSDNEKKIRLSVKPLFVETIWFKILIALLIVGIIVGLSYFALYMRKMRNFVQKKYDLLKSIEKSTERFIPKTKPATWHNVSDKEFIMTTTEFFKQNINNSNFVIEDLAKYHGMSRSKYYNKVKAITGLSPIDFIKQLRIKHAIKLLDKGMSIADVAYATGFNDPKYFSRCFNAEMGIKPSEYRKLHRTNK